MNNYLKKCINKKIPIIFDYDGVLFEARWYETRINMQNETEEKLLAAMQNGENLYTVPISFMIDFVENINDNELFVLSHIHNNIEFDVKYEQITKFYSKIPKEHIFWATSPDDKIKYMEKIEKEFGGFIYIDDTHPNLIKFENYFSENCKFFHVSSLYV